MLIHGLTLSWAFIYMYLICARAFIGHDLTLSLVALASHSLTQLRYPPHPGGDPTRSQYRVVETREYNFIYIMYIMTSVRVGRWLYARYLLSWGYATSVSRLHLRRPMPNLIWSIFSLVPGH